MIACFCTYPVIAQNSSITVSTDKMTYADGDQMVIAGTVSAQLNVPISVVVRDPSGHIVLIGQVSPNQDNAYSTTVTTGGDLWTQTGTYEVDVTYGSENNAAKTTFKFVGSEITLPITIQGKIYNVTYTITNGKVLDIIPTESTKSLTVRIQPSGQGVMWINMPRSLIDSKDNGEDSHFLVQDNGVPTAFNETRTDTVGRTLAIPFGPANTEITIIGTQIVPEFNSVPILILAMAMLAITLYFRSKIQIKL